MKVSTEAMYGRMQAGFVGNPEFFIPRSIEDIPVPPPVSASVGARQEWAAELGGAEAQGMLIQLIVRGTSPEPVVLIDLKLRVVSREPAPPGVIIGYQQDSGSAIEERILTYDILTRPPTLIDSSDNRFLYEESSGEGTERPVVFPYQVSNTDVEVFYISVSGFGMTGPPSVGCDCRWEAELLFDAAEEEGSIIINADGEPFRTIFPRASDQSFYSVEGEPLVPGYSP